MVDFMNLTVGIACGVIGIVVAASVLSGVFPTLTTALTNLTTNNAGIPMKSLLAPTGVIPLLIVAVFIIAIVVGLFALVPRRGKR